ncbi:hypothetical protein WN943_006582 [Citrus x changshan-huyou]
MVVSTVFVNSIVCEQYRIREQYRIPQSWKIRGLLHEYIKENHNASHLEATQEGLSDEAFVLIQEISYELDTKVKKYLRGEGANLEGQLPLREELYGKSAKAAAKVEKNLVHILWILPSSGRYMAVAGRKGHIAVVDMNNMNLVKEIQVREIVRDVVFLHNELFFAAAQKKGLFWSESYLNFHCWLYWILLELDQSN